MDFTGHFINHSIITMRGWCDIINIEIHKFQIHKLWEVSNIILFANHKSIVSRSDAKHSNFYLSKENITNQI